MTKSGVRAATFGFVAGKRIANTFSLFDTGDSGQRNSWRGFELDLFDSCGAIDAGVEQGISRFYPALDTFACLRKGEHIAFVRFPNQADEASDVVF